MIFLFCWSYAVSLKNILIDEAESNGEDRAASSDDTIDDTQLPLEVVPEDGEGGGVDQGGPGAEHDPVGEVEEGDVLVEESGETHAQCGQDCSDDGGESETNLVTEDSNKEREEECCPDSQGTNQSWNKDDDIDLK